MTVKQLIENWIHVSPNSDFHPLLVEEGAATTMADFLGDDTSDPGARGKNIYANPQNLPTAISSILNKSQKRANFHPAVDTPEEVKKTYASYIKEIDENPFLHIDKNEHTKQRYDSNDYNKLIDNVVSLYDGITAKDKDKIKNSIAEMAKSVFSQTKAEQWKNLFSQSTIDYSDVRAPKLLIFYTTLYMKHEDKGKAGVTNVQEYTVNKATYSILGDLIIASADQLVALDKKNVDDWLSESTSPERNDPKLCFKVLPYGAKAKEMA